jgi:hypothetical protein
LKLSRNHPRWNDPDVQRLRYALTIANETLHWDKVNVWMVGLVKPPNPTHVLAELQATLVRSQANRDRVHRELVEALTGIRQPDLPLD